MVERPAEVESEQPTGRDPVEADRRRFRFFAIWGAVVVCVLALFRAVLLPFFLAIVLAYVFEPIVAFMTRPRSGRAMPRWVAVVILYLGVLTTLGTLLAVGVPQLLAEAKSLAVEWPERVGEFRREVVPRAEGWLRGIVGDAPSTDAPASSPPASLRADTSNVRIVPLPDGGFEVVLPERGLVVVDHGDRLVVSAANPQAAESDDLESLGSAARQLTDAMRAHSGSVVSYVGTLVKGIVKPIFTFFIMLMLSAYALITKDAIFEFFRVLVRAEKRERFDGLMRRIDRGLSGVVRGQLLICVVNGVLSGIGFYALGLRYWWLLTIVATVLSIIPIFGAILSSVPAVLIGLQISLWTGGLTLAWILLIHQIEANLLNPKIMGDSAKVHPALVVFALLSGEHLFGIAGALLAVPVLSITQSIFLHNRELALGIAAPKADRSRS